MATINHGVVTTLANHHFWMLETVLHAVTVSLPWATKEADLAYGGEDYKLGRKFKQRYRRKGMQSQGDASSF